VRKVFCELKRSESLAVGFVFGIEELDKMFLVICIELDLFWDFIVTLENV